MNDKDLHLMSGAYVLDGLDDLERAAFQRHLATCHSCQLEVAGLAATTAEIGIAQQVTPPESLRANVLAAASQTTQASPRASEATSGRRWTKALLGVAVAASVVGAFALGSAVNSPAPADLLVDDQTQMMIATAPDAKMMPMEMTDGAHSSVVVSTAEGQALLIAADIPMPKGDDVYQMWLIDQSGAPHDMDKFRPDSDGRVTLMMKGDFTDAAALEITMEPAGGSSNPTSPAIGTVRLT
jgi:anti-sigma-K factor RskA